MRYVRHTTASHPRSFNSTLPAVPDLIFCGVLLSWMRRWRKYVGWDTFDRSFASMPSINDPPGPITNEEVLEVLTVVNDEYDQVSYTYAPVCNTDVFFIDVEHGYKYGILVESKTLIKI